MLYERWQQIVQTHRNEVALQEFASRRRWTFGELAEAAGKTSARDERVVFPQGANAEVIFAVLRAWRFGKVVCPLESGQTPSQLGDLPGGCVHLKTTSASTGAARLIAFTAEQLAADAENIVSTMGLRREWPNLGVISLAHSYGFSNLITPLLLHGIPLILAGAPLPETIRRAATLAKFITLPAVPAMWRAWHEAGAIPPNIRLAISAGAPLPLALEESVFSKSGLKIHNFYGASESGGIAYDPGESPRTDAACVGAPLKNVQLSVAAGGCLEVRSRAVGQTYLPMPDSNLSNGCFRTSDLAEMICLERGRSPSAAQSQRVGDGRSPATDDVSDAASRDGSRSEMLVHLRGRAGDQINVAGRKVSPETIERVLIKHPHVNECLIFGVPSADSGRTEEIVVVVVSSEREESLRQFALQSLPAWQCPRHWWFVEALQTNPRGKVSRAEWRQRWLAKMK